MDKNKKIEGQSEKLRVIGQTPVLNSGKVRVGCYSLAKREESQD